MMKKFLSLMAAAALTLTACDKAARGPEGQFSGVIREAADSVLYLQHSTMDGLVVCDSVRLDAEGRFALTGDTLTGSPEFYNLRIGRRTINVAVDSSECIVVNASLPTMDWEYTVEGNEASKTIKEICLKQQEVQRRLIALETNSGMLPGELTDSIKAIVDEYREDMRLNYVVRNPQSASAYYALMQHLSDALGSYMLFNPAADRTQAKAFASVASSWDIRWPNAARTVQLKEMAEQAMKATAPVREVPLSIDDEKVSETGIIGICLPDAKSKLHDIAELKGKVVLLDFTQYSAAESAQRNMVLRQLYDKYKERGFEIYQISLDDDTHFWMNATDNLPWVCVHETDGSTTRTYGIVNLPTFFLINRDNEVDVRSDFMEGTLESNIERLL